MVGSPKDKSSKGVVGRDTEGVHVPITVATVGEGGLPRRVARVLSARSNAVLAPRERFGAVPVCSGREAVGPEGEDREGGTSDCVLEGVEGCKVEPVHLE